MDDDKLTPDESARMSAEYDTLKAEFTVDEDPRDVLEVFKSMDILQDVYYLWALWADFHVRVLSPELPDFATPVVIEATETTYRIVDYGARLSTSPGEELVNPSRAMGKLYNTIEKMLALVLEKVSRAGGDEEVPEIRVAFDGHELAQRKGFNVCVSLPEPILVTNFDPGPWGEQVLQAMETLASKGFLPGI